MALRVDQRQRHARQPARYAVGANSHAGVVPMEYQTIIDERHGAVARIITNRPRYKNAQSRLMIEELESVK